MGRSERKEEKANLPKRQEGSRQEEAEREDVWSSLTSPLRWFCCAALGLSTSVPQAPHLKMGHAISTFVDSNMFYSDSIKFGAAP